MQNREICDYAETYIPDFAIIQGQNTVITK